MRLPVARVPSRVRQIVSVLALVAVVRWLVWPQVSGHGLSFAPLLDVDSFWIYLGVLSELLSLGFFAATTRSLLKREVRPSLATVVRIDLSTVALSHCLPAGGAAGTAFGWRLLTRAGVPSTDAGFAKLAQGLGAAVVLQVLLWSSVTTRAVVHGHLLASLVLPALLGLGFAAQALFVRQGAPGRLLADRAVARLRDAARRIAGADRRRSVAELLAQLRDKREARRLAGAAGMAALNWLFDAGALWAALHAYGHGVDALGLLIAFGVANTVAWLPITPSGLGIAEAAMIPTLVLFGSPRHVAVLGVLTWRLLAYWLPIPLGGLAYGSLRRTHRRMRLRDQAVQGAAAPQAAAMTSGG